LQTMFECSKSPVYSTFSPFMSRCAIFDSWPSVEGGGRGRGGERERVQKKVV